VTRWIYATHPDASIRNGVKAKEYAVKACELSEWKAYEPLETLAAAFAETGHYTEAAQWQNRALELAPAKYKVELGSRLQRYQSGNPYRTPMSDAE
jgi:hypothetical protein